MESGDQSVDSLWRRFRRWLARFLAGEDSLMPTEPAPPAPNVYDGPSVDLDDEEAVTRAGVEVDRRLEEEFQRSLSDPVRVVEFRVRGVEFFGVTQWRFQPSVNVLLGRNGYGKSLVLRMLAGMLQRDRDATDELFKVKGAKGTIELGLARGGESQEIRRDHEVFLTGSAPKVPLLAIPDARFVDRSTMVVSSPSAVDLAYHGADHFLRQLPYQATVENFLMGLCLEYWRNGNSFRTGTFELLNNVMSELTGRTVGFDRIESKGRTGGVIFVRTDGLDRPLEIQRVSQGTISILVMFGLVHQFLEDLARAAGVGQRRQPCIVIIDEIDAHLHPEWQRRIRKLLADTFPQVQFIVTAHSPLVVAGCGPDEVAVLRRPHPGGPFQIQQLEDDFVGALPGDLYSKVFEIEARDEVFLEAATTKARGKDVQLKRQMDELVAKQRRKGLSAEEKQRLGEIALELGRIDRVEELEERRRDKDDRIAELDAEVARLRAQLEAQEAPE
jgi:energy-coupling factor transporter ATP-binding protein EcfA2